MKVEYVAPFVEAAVNVFGQFLGVVPERGQMSAQPKMFTTQQVNVVFGISGEIQGQVIYGMSMISADKVASKMLGAPVVTFDQMAASAISELGNIISGNSITALADNGFECSITPPTLIRGSNVKIDTVQIPALVIPLNLPDIGTFEINVSVQETAA